MRLLLRAAWLVIVLLALIRCAPAAPSPAANAPTVASATAAVTSAAPAAQSGGLVPLKMAYTAISVAVLPIWVAYDQGLFQKNGIDPAMQYVATSPVLTASMLSGEVQIAHAAEEVVLNSDLSGGDVVILASGGDRLLFSLYATSGITNLADLKGKKIGVTNHGSSTDFAARWLLTHNGLQPDKDVALISLGGVPNILQAMQAGAVDAGVVSPPTSFKAQTAGFKELVDFSTLSLPYYQSPVIARKSWVKDNPDTLRKFVKAYVEAVAFIKRNKAETEKIIGKYTKTTDTAELDGTYDGFNNILPQTPSPRADAIQMGLDFVAADHPQAKSADPTQFFDASWVEELDKNGFIASLYK
jgi:NitT/TauT family transport system substrate-binding protein